MGTALTGLEIKDTYDGLVKTTDNGPISGTLKALSDGLGNDSTLSLSTTAASIAGTLAVSGNATFDTNTLFVDAANNRVGVGTITPEAKLDIVGSAAAGSVGMFIENSAASTTNNSADIYFGTWGGSSIAGITNARISAVNTLGVDARTDLDFYTYDGAASGKRVSITSGGVLSLTQGQIKFPATQVASADANTLDDYEEGTWTMGVSFGGASVGATYVLNTGRYTKIGRQVTASGYLALTSKGSSTGDAAITGLPFTSGNTFQAITPAALRLDSVSFTNAFQGYVDGPSTTISLGEVTLLGVASNLTNADFTDSSAIMVSVTYTV